VVWLVLLFVFAPLGSKLTDETENGTESFLPKSADSTEVARILNTRFPGGQTLNGIIVYRHPGGLTAADKRKIVEDARRAQAELPLVGRPVLPFGGGRRAAQVSPDGELAYTVVFFPTTSRRSATGARSCATSPATAAVDCARTSPAMPATTRTSRRSSARSTCCCWARRCCSYSPCWVRSTARR
jgi:uncharacterized membrane protein YdfJ with MMPL/SSD domain